MNPDKVEPGFKKVLHHYERAVRYLEVTMTNCHTESLYYHKLKQILINMDAQKSELLLLFMYIDQAMASQQTDYHTDYTEAHKHVEENPI